jgi:SAM-dependent methyltransferase
VTDRAPLHESLSVFRDAVNWKAYWSNAIAPYVGDRVLEAGAGVGANTALLQKPGKQRRWICMEPDLALIETLKAAVPGETIVASTVDAFAETAAFDTILYIDVLEHIADDGYEVRKAGELLAPGGKLIVLSPAYNVLFSEFDRAIGHFRRYSRASLRALTPDGLRLIDLFCLDAAGLLLSLGNRVLLREKQPTRGQIRFWDRAIVPISRAVDPLIGHGFGRSIIAVWERDA